MDSKRRTAKQKRDAKKAEAYRMYYEWELAKYRQAMLQAGKSPDFVQNLDGGVKAAQEARAVAEANQ
jgi:hypothetical protein